MDYKQDHHLEQTLAPSPQLVISNRILALSTLDYQELVQLEQEDNPALEVETKASCAQCGCPVINNVCIACEYIGDTAAGFGQLSTVPGREDRFQSSLIEGDEEDIDRFANTAASISMADSLITSLQSQLPPRQWPIIEYLVGNLNPDGRLLCSMRDTAEALATTLPEVEEVLKKLQALDPPGIGARDVQECLLIQLGQLEDMNGPRPFERTLIREHLEDLYLYRYPSIAAALGTTVDEVKSGLNYIKRNLNPFPGRAYVSESETRERLPRPAVPDAMVTVELDKEQGLPLYVVSSIDDERYTFRVSRAYREQYDKIKDKMSDLTNTEQAHVIAYYTRATQFKSMCEQRSKTLIRVVQAVVRRQHLAIERGPKHLEPLTRGDIAGMLHLHESTVSRAVAGKHVLLPDGRLAPLREFFTANLAAKSLISKIVTGEAHPLTDHEIMERLSAEGVSITRRLVARYRKDLDIAASPHRPLSRHKAVAPADIHQESDGLTVRDAPTSSPAPRRADSVCGHADG